MVSSAVIVRVVTVLLRLVSAVAAAKSATRRGVGVAVGV